MTSAGLPPPCPPCPACPPSPPAPLLLLLLLLLLVVGRFVPMGSAQPYMMAIGQTSAAMEAVCVELKRSLFMRIAYVKNGNGA